MGKAACVFVWQQRGGASNSHSRPVRASSLRRARERVCSLLLALPESSRRALSPFRLDTPQRPLRERPTALLNTSIATLRPAFSETPSSSPGTDLDRCATDHSLSLMNWKSTTEDWQTDGGRA